MNGDDGQPKVTPIGNLRDLLAEVDQPPPSAQFSFAAPGADSGLGIALTPGAYSGLGIALTPAGDGNVISAVPRHEPPSVVRAVHYYTNKGAGPYAAIVTRVCDPVEAGPDACDLVVFDQTGISFELVVPFAGDPDAFFLEAERAGDASDCWTWPPRVTGGESGIRRSERPGL